MSVVTIVSLVVNVLLFALVCVGLVYMNKAGKAINDYEQFHNNSIDKLETHMLFIQNIIRNNVILSGDEDVKTLFQSMQAYYETLFEYRNAKREIRQELLQ